MKNFLGSNEICFPVGIFDDSQVKLKTHGILSRNFLREEEISFCERNTKLEHKGQQYSLLKLDDKKLRINTINKQTKNKRKNRETIVRVQDDVIIEPMSTTYIPAKRKRATTGKYWFSPIRDELAEGKFGYATSVHEFKKPEQKFHVCMINMTPTQKILKKNTPIGEMFAVDQDTPDTLSEKQLSYQDNGKFDTDYEIYSFETQDTELINEIGEENLLETTSSPPPIDEMLKNAD